MMIKLYIAQNCAEHKSIEIITMDLIQQLASSFDVDINSL